MPLGKEGKSAREQPESRSEKQKLARVQRHLPENTTQFAPGKG